MNINDKIKQILIEKNLSPSHFADEIGVQRSSISHILSGRNRPSFDIIQKIIRRFPDLGFDWILEEEAVPTPPAYSIPSNTNRYSDRRPSTADRSIPTQPVPLSTIGIRTQRAEIAPMSVHDEQPISTDEIKSHPVTNKNSSAKTVERILIFFSDGTFREYSPA